MNNYKNFTFIFLTASFSCILIVCLLAFFVDAWDLKGIAGLTTPKIKAYDTRSVHFGFQPIPDGEHRGKSLNVIWRQPEAVIFGSSVVARGVNPDNSFWNPNGSFSTYNYGMSGLSIREMEQHFQHLQALKPTKKLFIGLDFFAFNALKPAVVFEKVKILPFAHQLTYKRHLFQILVKVALSTDYLKANLRSFKYINKSMNFIDAFPNKLIDKINGIISLPAIDPKTQKFLQNQQLLQSQHAMISALYPRGKKGFKFEDINGWSSYEAFKRIIKSAQEKNGEIILCIPPCHARMLEIIDALGLWDTFIEWKRTLVNIINEIALCNPNHPPIPLWDFAYHNAITILPINSTNDTNQPLLFVDPIHFEGKVGDYVLSVIYGHPTKDLGMSESVGVQLTRHNIEKHLQGITELKKKYQKDHSKFSREVKDVVESIF